MQGRSGLYHLKFNTLNNSQQRLFLLLFITKLLNLIEESSTQEFQVSIFEQQSITCLQDQIIINSFVLSHWIFFFLFFIHIFLSKKMLSSSRSQKVTRADVWFIRSSCAVGIDPEGVIGWWFLLFLLAQFIGIEFSLESITLYLSTWN